MPNKLPTVTVDALCALYLRHCAANNVHSNEARSDRVKTLGLFVERYGIMPVSECKPFHLTDFILEHETWKSVSTKRAKSNMVRACFEWAAIEERIQRNPFRRVRFEEAPRRPDMDDETFELLCSYANKPFERCLRFLRYTACRLGELCNADWEQFDLQHGVWTIPKHKTQKRTGRPKVVALVPEAVELLERIQAVSASGPVFTNSAGTHWNRVTLGQQLRRMKRRHGINCAASLHGIRHRFGSCAVANGAPLKLVAAQMGHRSVTTTERYYVCLDNEIEAIRAAASKGVKQSVTG